MFNAGDLLGRGLAGLGPWAGKPPRTGVLITYALGRVALLVGLMFCNVFTPHQWRLPRLIRSGNALQHQRLSCVASWSSLKRVVRGLNLLSYPASHGSIYGGQKGFNAWPLRASKACCV
jgi:hypothetical protein